MDNLKQLLPKYNIHKIKNRHEDIQIIYDKLYSAIHSNNYIYNHINQYKFIHDNIDYIIEMLLANGFLQNTNHSNIFTRNDIYIRIYYCTIQTRVQILDNPETMFDDLRKIINIDIPYKPVQLHGQKDLACSLLREA